MAEEIKKKREKLRQIGRIIVRKEKPDNTIVKPMVYKGMPNEVSLSSTSWLKISCGLVKMNRCRTRLKKDKVCYYSIIARLQVETVKTKLSLDSCKKAERAKNIPWI